MKRAGPPPARRHQPSVPPQGRKVAAYYATNPAHDSGRCHEIEHFTRAPVWIACVPNRNGLAMPRATPLPFRSPSGSPS